MSDVEMTAGILWGLMLLGLFFLVAVVPFLVFLGFVTYDFFLKRRARAK